MAEAHLSIGEVLSLLQDEFPDVTISKIRFLESQGLVDPERTPSGYRKFYEADIARLRWILVQQREHFLPLKVIKERLEAADGIPDDMADDAPPAADPAVAAQPESAASVGAPGAAASEGSDGDGHVGPAAPTAPESAVAPTMVETAPAPTRVRASMPAGEVPGDADGDGVEAANQPVWMADLALREGAKSVAKVERAPLDGGPTDVSLTASELCASAAISREALRDLEQYGLLTGRPMGDDIYYDGDALVVASRSAGFLSHGISARHLRMFKVSAEREAGFLEQLAMPMLKQRSPEARKEAVELVESLVDLGGDLRAALLRANLRRHLDPS